MSINQNITTNVFERSGGKPVRVLSVTSGKGGVGKTNVVVNLAMALAQLGQHVLVWDADLGLANIDVLLGLKPQYTINNLLEGDRTLREILVEGPCGFKIMPASSGIQELSQLGEGHKMRLLTELDEYDQDLNYLLIDTGAGISSNVMYFNLAAQERIVVVTPEPTSITDAYALIKVMSTKYNEKRFKILPNQVTGVKEAKAVFSLLAAVADQHLSSISLDYIGFIPRDDHLLKAVRQQRAVLDAYPGTEASKHFKELAKNVMRLPSDSSSDGNIKFFWRRLFKI